MGACNHLGLVNYLSGFFSRYKRRRLPAIYHAVRFRCMQQASQTYRNIPCVLEQHSPLLPQLAFARRFPFLHAPRLFFLVDKPVDDSVFRINNDTISILHESNGSSQKCFWDNVPDDKSVSQKGLLEKCTANTYIHTYIYRPVRGSTESSIRNKGSGISQTCSYQCSSRTCQLSP